MHITYTVMDTPVSPLLAAETRQGLMFVAFGDDGLDALVKYATRWYKSPRIIPSVVEAAGQLLAYFSGELKEFDLKVALPRGTDFQREVWRAVAEIPYGQRMTYAQLATALGRGTGAARAVGQACGANPLPLVVPCHRVVSANGGLGGYGGGLEIKEWLLGHEAGNS